MSVVQKNDPTQGISQVEMRCVHQEAPETMRLRVSVGGGGLGLMLGWPWGKAEIHFVIKTSVLYY